MTNAAAAIGGFRDKGSLRRPDFHPTPRVGIEALLGVETLSPVVWEPACGDGAISKVLEDAGHDVLSTDLNDWGYGQPGIDFLMCAATGIAPEKPFDIVTNPPFKLAEEFVETAMTCGPEKLCLLLRLNWLEGQRRKELFSRHPLARVWVFSKRLPMMHRHDHPTRVQSSSAIAFAWFVWDRAHDGPPTLGWV